MSSKHDSTGFAVQVVTGGLAAITAALLGSTLGVAGTVAGAGVASVVTTVAAALYARSIQHTRERVRLIQAKVTGHMESPVRPGDAERPAGRGDVPAGADPEGAADRDDREAHPPVTPRRRGRAAMVAATVLAFALGMLAITGFEWISGHRVDGGPGTTIGGIGGMLRPKPGPAPVDRPSQERITTRTPPPTISSTAPVEPSTGQPTSPPSPTSTTAPTSVSTVPVTEPPVTTTTIGPTGPPQPSP